MIVVLTEQAIQKGIRDCLERLGFTVFHNAYAIGSDPGFPDLIGVSDDGLLVAVECKGGKGRIRPGQLEWLRRFGDVPGCVFSEVVGPRMGMVWEGYDDALDLIQRAVEERRTLTAAGDAHREAPD